MKYFILLFIFIITSCIGTDVLDDPMVEPSLEVDQDLFTLLVGESDQLTYTYENIYGYDDGTKPVWTISDASIASADVEGKITALKSGQTTVKGSINELESKEVLINVVDSEESIVKVLIQSPSTRQIGIGETLQLSSTAWNINDELITGTNYEWEVNNSAIASISNTGLLTGKSLGTVRVTAIIDGIKSVPLSIDVGVDERTGTFVSSGSYDAQGTATLRKDSNGDVILTFSDDFKTSFALGTFIYMSNSTSGSDTKAAGLELEEITENGAKSFNVSSYQLNVTLDSYKYVIILCKPASITFGYAELN